MDSEIPGRYYPRASEAIGEFQKQPLSEEIFRQIYQFEPDPGTTLLKKLKKETHCTVNTLYNLFPILKWLPRYRKEDLISDVVSGLTVAVMHIPQGMAYAVLGGVPPVTGIYMAFFPVLIYILMGTSRHVSMGTFAVVSMMTGKSVDMLSQSSDDREDYKFVVNGSSVMDVEIGPTPVEVATVVCFTVGVWQVIFGAFRLGTLAVLLSDTLISGFTTGAAIHVFSSQVKNLFGLRIRRHSGTLKVIYTFYDIFANIGSTNLIALSMSVCTLTTLVIYGEFVKPFLQRKFKRVIPIPIELIIVIIATLVSTQFDLNPNFDVPIVDHVPTGLPVPAVPPIYLLPRLLVDGLVIGIVAISINISMASIFAKKMNYEIDGNQEVLASGVGNIFGSFFSCMPYAVSLSRSLIQQSVGGKTQLASVVSCTLLVFVLLFIAPFFEPLPFCVLSSIIVVALKGMFLQLSDFPRIFRLSKLDGFVWMVTFLSVVVVDIDYGLGIGLVASVGTMLYRSQCVEVTVLGRIPGTKIYRDRKAFKRTHSIDNVILLKISGGLHFANVSTVRDRILQEVPNFHRRVIVQDPSKPSPVLTVILNMSSVTYMDPSAVKTLTFIVSDLEKLNIITLLCEISTSVYDSLQACNFFIHFPISSVFPTTDTALDYIERLDNQQKAPYQIS